MNVIVFLLIAGAASARHVPEVQFNNRGIDGDVVVERRNDGHINHNSESTPYVNSDFRQSDKVIPTKTNQRFVQSTVKYNGQNHEASLNNINDYENNHRLRTNAYTTEEYSTTEYTVQDFNVYTNRKGQKFKDNKNPVNQDSITGQVYQRGSHSVGFFKNNEQKLRPENTPAVNKQEKRRPETSVNIPIQYPKDEKTNNITNHPKKSGSVLKTVTNPTDQPREDIERLPKTDSDEQIWLWGTEGPIVTTTEIGSLDDRAAFTGDQCPTGKAKVKGVCVEKH